jgi:hypothetical protein
VMLPSACRRMSRLTACLDCVTCIKHLPLLTGTVAVLRPPQPGVSAALCQAARQPRQ